MKQLRTYQEKAINSVNSNLDKDIRNQLLVMATGTGKTFTAANIIKNKKTLWITHTEELINQSASVMRNEGFTTGIIKQDKMELDNDVVVASIQTLWRRLDMIDSKQFDTLIVDEAHMAMAKTWQKAFNHFDADLKLGLTATPWRGDGMPLGDLFDKIVYQYNIQDGIKDKFLCEIDAYRIRTQLNIDSVKTTAGDLNIKDLRIINCEQRNKLIVEKHQEYAKERPTVVFCVDVQHAIDLCQKFINNGISASFVVGDKKLCPDREDRIEKFKSGEIQVMCNVMVLTHGFDYPELSCVIMACPTKSLTKYFQCIGRGTRLKDNSNDCIILDIVDVCKRHKIVNTWTLDKDKPPEKKVFITENNRKIEIEKHQAEIESFLLSQQDEQIDLFEVPKVNKSFYSDAFKEPASEKQINWLSTLGYDVLTDNYTKGMASKIIGSLPATDKQLKVLARKGYKVNETLTRDEAQACFDDINKRNGKPTAYEEHKLNQVKNFISKL
tara:strand:+ start:5096 stop:6586 length:1491 start_codon:yes stop_codon:yes gene_type:complete